MSNFKNLNDFLGRTDIYLVDFLQSWQTPENPKVLDAGSGSGRNLSLLASLGADLFAVDMKPKNVQRTKDALEEAGFPMAEDRALVETIGALPFEEASFDLVICNAVLHFSDNEAHFGTMVEDLWRVVKPGGYLFTRLCSDIGIEEDVQALPDRERWFKLPDGSDRFLVDHSFLTGWTEKLGATIHGHIKTVHVHGLRCMTNWVLHKPEVG